MPTPLINEIRPNPSGADPVTQTLEILGTPGASFAGFLFSIEADFDLPQSVDSKAPVSGVFDVNGLLTVTINDLENPSFTLVLTDDTATANVGDSYDGSNASIFGTIYDAIGIADDTADEGRIQGAALGGSDFAFTGDEPKLIFRDGTTGELYAVNDPDNGEVIDQAGNVVDPAEFDIDPLASDTFGAVNPTRAAAAMTVLINEFQPNPAGADPATQQLEISGTPGASFSGFFYSIEADFDLPQTIDHKSAVSGTFDANGLLTISVPDLENPSFTLVLTDDTATANVGDSYDGSNASIFGTIYDAIGIADDTADEVRVQGAALGGSDFAFTGDEPKLIFRDGTTGDLFAVNDPDNGEVIDQAGNVVDPADFDMDPLASDTFGAVNPSFTGTGSGGGTGGGTTTAIYDIQGKAHSSPFTGTSVMTSGIVTAVAGNGFYLQDAAGDGDIATSDGIFVYTASAPSVAVGDAVDVSGTVTEFFPGGISSGNLSITEIVSPSVTVQSSGNALPAATVIGQGGRIPVSGTIDDDAFTSFDVTTDGIDFFESLEGMLVTAQDVMAVIGTNRFGEIFGVVDQGADATGLSARGTLNISPTDFNPERIQIDADSGILPGFAFPDVAAGDLLGDVTGVVSYDFGNFQIHPTQVFTPTSGGLTPEVSTIVGDADTLTIASYNVLNLDVVIEDPNNLLPGVSGGVDDDLGDGRFDAIAQQIVNNLNTPDIIGLQEIQDNTGAEGTDSVTSASATLQALVDAIIAAGGPTYSFIDNTFIGDDLSGGIPGGNIRTAFLYNDARVDLVPGSVQTIGGQGVGEAFEGGRLPLVADFQFNGETVTVVNNHLSSKGGSAPIMGVEQPFDARQEDVTVNGSLDERQAQSAAIQNFLASKLAVDPNAKLVTLGDMNEFEFVSPVAGIEAALDQNHTGTNNLTETLPDDERYSYTFQGNSQSLDHILVSDSLEYGAQFDAVHVNSEFAETAARASDHDPVLAGLKIPAAPATPQNFVLELLHVTDQEPLNLGGKISDVVNTSAVMNALQAQDLFNDGVADNTLRLSSGDAFIPGLFYDASAAVFGSAGIADIQIQNELGFAAIALGNHEFDFGSDSLADLLDGTAPGDFSALIGSNLEGLDFTGADFPYLSANLDFSTDPDLGPLAVAGGQAPMGNVVTSSTVVAMPANGGAMAEGENGYNVTPIFTVGETINSYTPTGVLDGLGAFELDANTVRVLANSELANFDGHAYSLANGLSLTGARVHYFDIDKTTKQIVDSGLAFDTVFTADGNELTDVAGLVEGRVGFDRFCSAALFEAEQFGTGMGLTDRIYFTGEETGGNFSNVSGNEWALDPATGTLYAVPAMGRGAWENVTEVDTGTTSHVAFILMDDTSPFDADADGSNEAAPVFLYVGEKNAGTGGFLDRNGLEKGKLFVWASDTGETLPSQFNGAGASLSGSWVEIDNNPNLALADNNGLNGFDEFGYPTQRNLWAQAEAAGAFGFSRPEDASTNPADGSEVVLASTGVSSYDGGADTVGTLYTAKIDFTDIDAPTADFTVLYDGDADAAQALRSPDNLDWADDGMIYVQEDRAVGGLFGPNSANPNDASIIKIDPTSGAVTRVAEINQDETRGAVDENVAATGQQDIGNWETSGILDVSTLFGEAPGSLFLFDVQAHALDDQNRFANSAQPRLTDGDLKEGGQLAFLSKDADLGDAAELIGIVGATTPTLGTISSPGGVGVSPTWAGSTPTPAELDALAADIQAEVDALLAANPSMNKVILLAHMQQINIELELAQRLSGVDIIVAGGSNTRLFDDNDYIRPGDSDQGQYPQFVTNADGGTTAVVNTDGSYKYVGRLVIEFDDQGRIIPASYDEDVSGAYATDDAGVAALNAQGLIDPEIQAIADAIETQILATESNVFGVSNVFLNGNRSGSGAATDPDGVRTQETNLGNLTADANLAEAQKTDPTVLVSIKNGGGIRASIGETVVPPGGSTSIRTPNAEVLDGLGNVVKPAGGISQTDIQTSLAFNNDLVVLTLTRAELVSLLEHGVSALPGVSGRFAQVSGIQFSYDPDLAAGSRVVSAAITDAAGNDLDVLMRNGVLEGDPNGTVRVVTLGFLAEPRFDAAGNFIGGGDGYPFPNTNEDPLVGEVGDPAVIARVNLVELEQSGVQTGDATFANDGTEQDALAEYLDDYFGDTANAYDVSDTGQDADTRIQNLNFRADTVIDAPVEPLILIGHVKDDVLVGQGANDIIHLRYGMDTGTGNGGADLFVFDGRKVKPGDAHTITDLNFGEGDSVEFRFFDQPRTIASDADLQFYLDNGYAQILQPDDANGAKSVQFFNLYSKFGTRGDTFVGDIGDNMFNGGDQNDEFHLRFGADMATGGAGEDAFVFDARFMTTGDVLSVKDLNFDENDILVFQGFANKAIRAESEADLLALDEQPWIDVVQIGDTFTLTLDNGSDQITVLV
ncbi:MAG: 5'-nucleotidase C-terminal domain-containing protein [Rhodobacteraceae bacterium]|nr:5'-nucleotidase C-terminal domain-containing protein [Paracoccaceae bacterium]